MPSRCLALLLGTALCSAAWGASSDDARALYDKYMDFRSLVKDCDFATHWDADGSNLIAGPAAPPAQPAEDPAAEAFGLSTHARFTPRSFKHQMFLAGEIDDHEVMSPDSEWLASIQDYDISLRSTRDGRAVALTKGGTVKVAWDFETNDSVAWSPDSLHLLASKVDRSKVFRMPQVHFLKRNEEVAFFYDQKAGAPLDHPEFYILSTLGQEAVHVDLGDTSDQYFRILSWLPDSSGLLMARFTRDFKRVDVMFVNARSGASRVVMSETSRTFVRLQHEIIFGGGDVGFTLLPGSRGFLWQSERDGWNHLYFYDLQGRLQRQLTRGSFPVKRVVGIDESGGWVYFLASAEARLYDQHLYRVRLSGGKMERLTEGEGTHEVALSPSKKTFRDVYSTVSRPPVTELRSVEGKRIKQLAAADISTLQAAGWVAPEEFWVKAADGSTDVRGVMYRPFDFDPQRHYPILEYIYGGPQVAIAPTQFCPRPVKDLMLPQAIAHLGYVVVIIDGRGTPGRSKAFQDVVYGEWGDHVVADHAAAIRQLVARNSYLDGSRVGVWGRSWGGHFALRLLAQAPDVYKAAVSIVPAFDAYAGILYEPFLDLPERNKAAYEAASIFRLAKDVKHPIMLMGGTSDSTYPDIMKMVAALTDANVPYELQLFPNQEHQIVGPAGDYQRDSLIRFFGRHLASSGANAQ